MGQNLSRPIMTTYVERRSLDCGQLAVASVQGSRFTHEDSHVSGEGIVAKDSDGNDVNCQFVAVFDGHYNDRAAKFVAEHLAIELQKEIRDCDVTRFSRDDETGLQHGKVAERDEFDFQNFDKNCTDEDLDTRERCLSKQDECARAFRNAFVNTDQLLQEHLQDDEAGCAAVCALICPTKGRYRILIGNAGDSRAVLWKTRGKKFEIIRKHEADEKTFTEVNFKCDRGGKKRSARGTTASRAKNFINQIVNAQKESPSILENLKQAVQYLPDDEEEEDYSRVLETVKDSKNFQNTCGRNYEFFATLDHKPLNPDERERIENSGGMVTDFSHPARVNGILSLSRAFGDFQQKSTSSDPELTAITCVPDVYEWPAAENDILLLACDGVFDVRTNSELVRECDSFFQHLEHGSPTFAQKEGDRISEVDCLGDICFGITKTCLETSIDNITLMIIRLTSEKEDFERDPELRLGEYETLKRKLESAQSDDDSSGERETTELYHKFWLAHGFTPESATRRCEVCRRVFSRMYERDGAYYCSRH